MKSWFTLEKTWRVASAVGSTVYNASGNFQVPYGKQILSVSGKSNDAAANAAATFNPNNANYNPPAAAYNPTNYAYNPTSYAYNPDTAAFNSPSPAFNIDAAFNAPSYSYTPGTYNIVGYEYGFYGSFNFYFGFSGGTYSTTYSPFTGNSCPAPYSGGGVYVNFSCGTNPGSYNVTPGNIYFTPSIYFNPGTQYNVPGNQYSIPGNQYSIPGNLYYNPGNVSGFNASYVASFNLGTAGTPTNVLGVTFPGGDASVSGGVAPTISKTIVSLPDQKLPSNITENSSVSVTVPTGAGGGAQITIQVE